MTTPVRLRLLWHPQAQFAGYLAAEQLGLAAARGVVLSCSGADFAQGPAEAVLAGVVHMAVASPAHMLESSAPEELVMLAAIQQESPLVYPLRRSAGSTPKALEGRRAAVWPGGEDLELRWLLHKAGVDLARVTFVPVVDTVAALVAGDADCAQMTTYHEIHELEHRGRFDAFTLLRPGDYGAALLKDGLIARRDWVTANQETVQAVLDSILEGWNWAFSDSEKAAALCAALRPDMPAAAQVVQLADIRTLSLAGATLTHGLGYPDPVHLQRAASAMRDMEPEFLLPPLDDMVDDRFWQAAPPQWRKRAW